MSTLAAKIIFNAKLAAQTERFDDVLDFMTSGRLTSADMTVEARNLFSNAALMSVGLRRNGLRALAGRLATREELENTELIALAKEYFDRLYGELKHISLDKVIKAVGAWNDASDSDQDVFFTKMTGDHYCYLIEFEAVSAVRERYIEASGRAYEVAIVKAAGLAVTNPRRLGLMLNYSVYLHDVKQKTQEACRVAKESFDNALDQLESVDKENYRDAVTIMSLLKDNVALWEPDHKDEQEK